MNERERDVDADCRTLARLNLQSVTCRRMIDLRETILRCIIVPGRAVWCTMVCTTGSVATLGRWLTAEHLLDCDCARMIDWCMCVCVCVCDVL